MATTPFRGVIFLLNKQIFIHILLQFKEKTKDWDFGTLLRIDASKGVSE